MEFIKALESVKAEGPFLLLTERNVEAFRDLNECNERTAVLGLEPFAVVTLLWTGGPRAALELKPDDSGKQYRFPGKPEIVVKPEPIAIPKQPQPGWKRSGLWPAPSMTRALGGKTSGRRSRPERSNASKPSSTKHNAASRWSRNRRRHSVVSEK